MARERFPTILFADEVMEPQIQQQQEKKPWEQHKHRVNSGECRYRTGLTCRKKCNCLHTRLSSIKPMWVEVRASWTSDADLDWRRNLQRNWERMSQALMPPKPNSSLLASASPMATSEVEKWRSYRMKMAHLMSSPGLTLSSTPKTPSTHSERPGE